MNIYEVLNKVIVNKRYELSSRLFDDKYRDKLISDILWSQRKVYCAAKVAAEAYWDLFPVMKY